MIKHAAKLTESEKQVLQLLWDREEPLTSSEIVQFCENRTWKSSYIHILINSLLEKKMIEVVGFKKTTKNYARTFQATMSREEYSVLQVKQEQKEASRTLSQIFAALLEDTTDEETIEHLSEMLEQRKKELDEQE